MTKKDAAAICLLFLVLLAFFWRGARVEGLFFAADEVASDLLHFSYPYREYWANEFLKQGKVPLWNPYLHSGLPMLAEAQTGVFFLPAVLLYFFLPAPAAFNWLIISSFLLVTTGMYFYTRILGLSRLGSLLGAIVFSLSGFMVWHLRHVPIITTVAFMPWAFWAAEKILATANFIWVIILAVFISLCIFAAHFTTTYSILLILTIYFILRMLTYEGDKRDKMSKWEKGRMMGFFIVGVASGILLASIQLGPSFELYRESTRVTQDFERSVGYPYQTKYLWFFIDPYRFGDPSRGSWSKFQEENFWENIGFVGLMPLILALIAMGVSIRRKSRMPIILTILTLFCLALVFGNLTPLYKLMWMWVPGFSMTRIPGRFFLFVDFFLSILAGLGLSILLGKVRMKRLVVAVALLSVSVVSLFSFGYGVNTMMPHTFLSEPKSVNIIRQDPALFRIRSLDFFHSASWFETWLKSKGWRGDLSLYIQDRERLPPDYNLSYRLSSPTLIFSSEHFSVKRSSDLDDFIAASFLSHSPHLTKLLGMENVKYVISPKELHRSTRLTLIYKKPGEVYIYENPEMLPRTYIVGKARSFSSPDEVLGYLRSPDFDPAKEVLLEESTEYKETSVNGIVSIKDYYSDKLNISVEINGDGYLVLSDTYYPGWRAFVDKQEVKIYRANYAYRSVKVPSGKHEVEFLYDPQSYRIGKVLTILTAILLLAALLNYFKRLVGARFWRSFSISRFSKGSGAKVR